MDTLYLKHLLIRTPFEGFAKKLQHISGSLRKDRRPELSAIYQEPAQIEEAMRRLISPASNCIDAGCHIGSTLSLMMKLAPRGKHAAFEPVPRKAAWLRGKFSEVAVHEMALSDVEGKISFFDDSAKPGFSGLRRRSGDESSAREITVISRRLDDVMDGGETIHFIKLDVEGAELLVLRGARKLIVRDRPALLFESAPGGAERLGFSDEALYRLLTEELGYSIYFVRDYLDKKPPIDVKTFLEAHEYPFKAYNYLALPAKANHCSSH